MNKSIQLKGGKKNKKNTINIVINVIIHIMRNFIIIQIKEHH